MIFIAYFYKYFVVKSVACGAVMPAVICAVPAQACRRIYLVAAVAHAKIVFEYDFKLVFAFFCKLRYIKFKRRKKSLVISDKFTVYKNLAYVVGALKAYINSLARKFIKRKACLVYCSVVALGSAVLRNFYLLRCVAVERNGKIVKLKAFLRFIRFGRKILHERLVVFTHFFKLRIKFFLCIHFFVMQKAVPASAFKRYISLR